MKFISWNVNGLRACVKKGFLEFFEDVAADIVAIQETKLQEGQLELELAGYEQYFNSAVKKGYSGTAVFVREKPIAVYRDYERMGGGSQLFPGGYPEGFESEGRILTLEYPGYFFVDVYTPNAQRELTRLEFRIQWEAAFREYLKSLDAEKPVIVCGDMNVAHTEIDLANPRSNRGNAGFTDEERGAFTELLGAGFTDSFRHLHPEETGAYSWWSYMGRAREKNVGWRIDYFLVSERINDRIGSAGILPNVMGSDHCPVVMEIEPPKAC